MQATRAIEPNPIHTLKIRITIPPEGDVQGVLFFSMPKLADRAPTSRPAKKSCLVKKMTVPVGDEKFQFVFAPQ